MENTCLEHQHSDTPSASVHSTTWYTIHMRQNTMAGHMGPDAVNSKLSDIINKGKHRKHVPGTPTQWHSSSFSTQVKTQWRDTWGLTLSTANGLSDITNKARKTRAWNTTHWHSFRLQYTAQLGTQFTPDETQWLHKNASENKKHNVYPWHLFS